MKRIAVFPGSFDPITKGHVALVDKASHLFDEIIVAMGINTTKNYLFDPETRLNWLRECFSSYENVRVEGFEGLTVDYCKKNHAEFILRGLRDGKDFEYEKSIAHMNLEMVPEIESVFLLTDPRYAAINSRIVREIIKSGGDASPFVPGCVLEK